MSLLLAGMLGGVGDGMVAFGGSMEKSRLVEEEAAARREERRLDRETRSEDRRLDREARQELLDARIAAGGARVGSSGSRSGTAGAPERIEEGSLLERELAGRAGMSVPEFRKFNQAEQTGNYSGYEKESTTSEPSEDPNAPMRDVTQRALPEGFGKFLEEKRKVVTQELSYVRQGKDADEVAKARGLDIENDVKGNIARAQDPGAMQTGSRKINAMQGQPEFKGSETGVTNEFTGQQSQNALGGAKVGTEKSKQTENLAQAGASTALRDKRRAGGDDGEMTNDQLNRAIESARKREGDIRKQLRDDPRNADLKDQLRSATSRVTDLQARQDARVSGKGDPKPEPKPEAKPALNALPAGAKKIGTSGGKDVYQLPDGRKVIAK